MAVTRITQLSDEERARCDEWADRWIDIGLSTRPADRERFEAAVRDCYRFAGIEWRWSAYIATRLEAVQ